MRLLLLNANALCTTTPVAGFGFATRSGPRSTFATRPCRH